MADLYVVRAPKRVGLHIQMKGTKENPSLMFFLPGMSKGQLDQSIRKELAKQGVTKESDINSLMDKAQEAYETRLKITDIHNEFNRLMDIRRNGGSIMKVKGKWKQAFFPAVSK